MKKEFHEISMNHNGILNGFDCIKEFYTDIVNVLSEVEQ